MQKRSKIMYSKEERDKKRYDAHKAVEEEKKKAREEEYWADPVTDKHSKKMQDKLKKAEEKARKKLEKLELTKAEMSNGRKKK